MKSPILSLSRRIRQTPFTPRIIEAGVGGYTVYNHMLLATFFLSIEDDYKHLKSAVQLWDVSCERQVEVKGPDALKLLQMLTPRIITPLKAGQCKYIPIVDQNGGMLNDAVLLEVAPNRYWISISDYDVFLWLSGIAVALKLNVTISEPDVSPLAIQGPLAERLLERVFGSSISEIKFFHFDRVYFENTSFIASRSGFSKQGGFEIYVEGRKWALPLWDALYSAGRDLDIRAGCPNQIERIEAGLLSYGNDMTQENSPFECGLDKILNGTISSDCIGRQALEKEYETGIKKVIRFLEIDGKNHPPCISPWPILCHDEPIGYATSVAYSPDFRTNVGIGMISTRQDIGSQKLSVKNSKGVFSVRAHAKPFI